MGNGSEDQHSDGWIEDVAKQWEQRKAAEQAERKLVVGEHKRADMMNLDVLDSHAVERRLGCHGRAVRRLYRVGVLGLLGADARCGGIGGAERHDGRAGIDHQADIVG